MKGNTYRLLCLSDDRAYTYHYLINEECSSYDIASAIIAGDFDTYESRKNKEAVLELERISAVEYAEKEQSADLDFSVEADISNKHITVYQTFEHRVKSAFDGNSGVFSEYWYDDSETAMSEIEELRQGEPIIVPDNGRK